MLKRLLPLLTLLPALAPAAQVVFTNSTDVTTYSMVTVDSRKLKTGLAAGLVAYPGEECIAFTDTNVVPVCGGFTINNGWMYPNAGGFPGWPNPNDPRKDLRIDGLKTKDITNFLSPGQCTAAGCPAAPPPVPLTLTFTRPTVEFGMMFRASWETQQTPFTTGFRVIANGVDLGTYPVPVEGVQTLGVFAPEGLKTVTIVPYNIDPTVVGPTVIHRIYTK